VGAKLQCPRQPHGVAVRAGFGRPYTLARTLGRGRARERGGATAGIGRLGFPGFASICLLCASFPVLSCRRRNRACQIFSYPACVRPNVETRLAGLLAAACCAGPLIRLPLLHLLFPSCPCPRTYFASTVCVWPLHLHLIAMSQPLAT
jgi:hypothetical protein